MTLNAAAVTEVTRTFNSLTGTYVTVQEYIERHYPGETEWRGDECGCTDDRCIGHHHDGDERCGCLDSQLDEFHDELADEYRKRERQASVATR